MSTDSAQPAAYQYDQALPASSLLLQELLKDTELHRLFESYYSLVHIPVAIIDLHANVLFSSRWQRICVQFHRAHPETCRRCVESDRQITAGLGAGQTSAMCHCENGLTDCAAPIVLEGGGRRQRLRRAVPDPAPGRGPLPPPGPGVRLRRRRLPGGAARGPRGGPGAGPGGPRVPGADDQRHHQAQRGAEARHRGAGPAGGHPGHHPAGGLLEGTRRQVPRVQQALRRERGPRLTGGDRWQGATTTCPGEPRPRPIAPTTGR